jgi:hypothetical protein
MTPEVHICRFMWQLRIIIFLRVVFLLEELFEDEFSGNITISLVKNQWKPISLCKCNLLGKSL